MSGEPVEVVGYELTEATALLEERGEKVVRVVRAGGRGDEGREMVVRQRRVEDGGMELTVCQPWALPREGGSEQDE